MCPIHFFKKLKNESNGFVSKKKLDFKFFYINLFKIISHIQIFLTLKSIENVMEFVPIFLYPLIQMSGEEIRYLWYLSLLRFFIEFLI